METEFKVGVIPAYNISEYSKTGTEPRLETSSMPISTYNIKLNISRFCN